MTHGLFNFLHPFSNNSKVNNFIQELQDFISKQHSYSLISSIRPYSLLTFAKNENNFAVCFDYKTKKIYYIPHSKIIGTKPNPGEALKLSPNGTLCVDYTAIIVEESKIDDYLHKCTIAK